MWYIAIAVASPIARALSLTTGLDTSSLEGRNAMDNVFRDIIIGADWLVLGLIISDIVEWLRH